MILKILKIINFFLKKIIFLKYKNKHIKSIILPRTCAAESTFCGYRLLGPATIFIRENLDLVPNVLFYYQLSLQSFDFINFYYGKLRFSP